MKSISRRALGAIAISLLSTTPLAVLAQTAWPAGKPLSASRWPVR